MTVFDPFEGVRLFNTTGGQVVRDEAAFDIAERRLRYDLIAEEVDETISKGFESIDFVETMDGLADTVYVTVGAALTHGTRFDLNRPQSDLVLKFNSDDPDEEAYARRHRAAFSRRLDALLFDLYDLTARPLASSVEEHERLVLLNDKWREITDLAYFIATSYGVDLGAVIEEVQASNMSKFGPNGEVYRRADGKTMKGPDYFRPDIPKVLRAQGFDV